MKTAISAFVHTLIISLAILSHATLAWAEPQHAIAMHGTPKHPATMTNFPYVNPDAPKGGRLTLGIQGSYDSLNPLIVRGSVGAAIRGYVYESLLARGLDEPFTLYGLIAEKIDVPEDRSSITFYLNPIAKFSDGQPITADDVLFSLEVLREKGRPNHRTYYKKVINAEKRGPLIVYFQFEDGSDREMPLIMGLMPVLPSHLLTKESFARTTLEPVIGSGPYTISKVDAGRSLIYKRNPNWWGRNLPVNRGRYNFDEIRYEYFREASVLFEAFKRGTIDARDEGDPAKWAEGYDIKPVKDGRIKKAEFDIGLPAGMSGLVFNTRRDVFKDQRVRKALIQMFDFEWINRNLFHNLYERSQSYFSRSILASTGQAANDIERRLLERFEANKIPEGILDGTYRFPVSPGNGQNRKNWRIAMELLKQAGYQLKNRKMTHTATGKQLTFEILASSPQVERLLLSYKKDLARLGIAMTIRVVDSAQYQLRRKSYDYDMVQSRWSASLSPGNEQLFRWSGAAGKVEGSFNYAGVDDPAVDAMINAMLAAKTSQEFVPAVRALDRVLLSGDYVIPLFHLPKQWLAHWTRIQPPKITPVFGYQLTDWWHKDVQTQTQSQSQSQQK
ncbi:MAG: extracellular solute-binding protein [Hyphomicrobiaceae bacterium]